MASEQEQHAVLIPNGSYGHIVPLLEFAKRLSSTHKVSFVVYDFFVEQLVQRGFLPSAKVAAAGSASSAPFEGNLSNIRVIPIPSSTSKDIDFENAGNFIQALIAFQPAFETALKEAGEANGWEIGRKASYGTPKSNSASEADYHKFWPTKPTSFTSDFFCQRFVGDTKAHLSWAADVPLTAFIPTAVAAYFGLYNEAMGAGQALNLDKADFSDKEISREELGKMMSSGGKGNYFLSIPRDMQVLLYQSSVAMAKADQLLIDSFDDLEPQIKAMFAGKNPELPPIRCVGPLCAWEMFGDGARDSLNEEQKKVLAWLDTQPAKSVVYVAFGSMAHLPDPQIRELETALKESGAPFLWSLRAGPQQEALSDATKAAKKNPTDKFIATDKALIAAWVPQRLVLSHPSVAAFVSHCGWNSSQESITAGVPLVTWPMFAEQHANAGFLRHLGISEPIENTSQFGRIVKSDEIVAAISKLLKSDAKDSPKTKAEALSARAKVAISEGGSSRKNWQSYPSW